MNEKEKMISGQLYNSADKELVELRCKVRKMTEKYNKINVSKISKREKLLKKIVGELGENVDISPNVYFDYGFNTYIGDNSYFNFNCTFLDCAPIKIGNNVFVGPNVSFLTPLHPLVATQRNIKFKQKGNVELIEYAKSITIGNNVWIAGNVTINAGVTIGNNCVIGSGSVVTKDIPNNFIAYGVPCKPIIEIGTNDIM